MQKFLVSLGLHLLKKHYTEETVIFCLHEYEVAVVTTTPLKFELNKLKLNATTNNDEKDT